MKHALKTWLRRAYARVLLHTGLFRLANRLAAPRLVVLAGHCVADDEVNGHLPRDMVVPREVLRRWLEWFGRHLELCTVSDGLARVQDGRARGGLVALTMDDGYRDNRTALLPLLAELRAPAAVYLETGVLDERRVNWSHKYFWAVRDGDMAGFAERYAAATSEDGVRDRLREALAEPARLGYHVKRVLKYEADPAERDRAVDAVFRALGGDEGELAERLFLTWDDARALREAGIELGAHSVHHPVLARLGADEQAREVGGSADALERELGERPATFAYPFGRRWDFDDASAGAVRAAGLAAALTSHAGAHVRGGDPLRIPRLCIDGGSDFALLVAEACGGFELLRRLGLDWSE